MEENIHIYSKCFECCIRQMTEHRAFEIYEYRREYNLPGDDKSDWGEAEAEILTKLAGGYKSLF